MGLRGIFEEALPGIFEAAAEAATFYPAAGAAIPCKVFIDFNVQMQPSDLTAQTWEQATVIEALLAGEHGIGRAPAPGETVHLTDLDETYTVRAIIENDRMTVKAMVT